MSWFPSIFGLSYINMYLALTSSTVLLIATNAAFTIQIIFFWVIPRRLVKIEN
jgi:hypothetical protein